MESANRRSAERAHPTRDLGFVRDAKIRRLQERVPVQRRVDFNQGVDAPILCKDPMYLRELATVCLKPLRIGCVRNFARKGKTNVMQATTDIAERISTISVSSTMKVAADADRLRREGADQ